MAITKKLIHFNRFSDFNTQKLSANRENTSYTVGVGGSVVMGEPYIRYQSIVFIKDVLKIWAHGVLYNCSEVDLSDYLTSEEIAEIYATSDMLEAKQDKSIKYTDLTADTWVSDSTYPDFPWRCDVTCEGVTGEMYADVVFNLAQSLSGSYAPVCETRTDAVSVWSSENISITIPTILITK